MNGRVFFEKFDGLIQIWAKAMSVFPRGFAQWVYRWHNGRSKWAILVRYVCLKAAAKSIGKNVCVMDHVYLQYWENLEIGDNVSIHEQCNINAFGGVRIGRDVSIAHGISVVSFNHTWEDTDIPIKYNPSVPMPVVIEDDVWVGCGVRILGGVTVGSRVVIAAGAVVTRDCEPNGVYAGVPARRVKEVGESDEFGQRKDMASEK